jgi:spore germination protein YaaH
MPGNGLRLVASSLLCLVLAGAAAPPSASAAPLRHQPLRHQPLRHQPLRHQTAPARLVSGWIPYWQLTDGVAAARAHRNLIGDASLFWYTATPAGQVVEQVPGGQPDRAALDAAIVALHAAAIRAFITVNDQGFDAASMAGLLRHPATANRLVRNLVTVASRSGADGIDIDFENMNFGGDRMHRRAVKNRFPMFLGTLRASLHASHLRLSIALPARTGPHDPSWGVIDYPAIAAHVDRARVMTYDVHTRSTGPGPIAPLPWVAAVAHYAQSQFGRRLSLGLPAYGYTWYVRTLSGTCPAGVQVATVGSTQDMRDIAVREHKTPTYVKHDAEYTFSYVKRYSDGTNTCRVRRVVWFEDARSVNAKVRILHNTHIGSVATWTLPDVSTASWRALRTYSPRRVALTVGLDTRHRR